MAEALTDRLMVVDGDDVWVVVRVEDVEGLRDVDVVRLTDCVRERVVDVDTVAVGGID